jgi:hypothetical protein
MGEVKPLPTVEEMAARNPGVHRDVLAIYRDALGLYREATENVFKNGAVTGHPKTGAPIVNPYLPIRDLASKTICAFHKDHPQFSMAETAGTDACDLHLDLSAVLAAGPRDKKRGT